MNLKIVYLKGTVNGNGIELPVTVSARETDRPGFPKALSHFEIVEPAAPSIPEGVYDLELPGHGTFNVRYQNHFWLAA